MRKSNPFSNLNKVIKDNTHRNIGLLKSSKRRSVIPPPSAGKFRLGFESKVKKLKIFDNFEKPYDSYQSVPYCSRGSLHGQREYTIIFRHERAGEFTVFEIDSRPMPQDGERLPVAMRAIAYVIALIVLLISILLATWLYIDFEFLRRVHWIKTNLVALVLIGMVKIVSSNIY